jgi:hypothetical protein
MRMALLMNDQTDDDEMNEWVETHIREAAWAIIFAVVMGFVLFLALAL